MSQPHKHPKKGLTTTAGAEDHRNSPVWNRRIIDATKRKKQKEERDERDCDLVSRRSLDMMVNVMEGESTSGGNPLLFSDELGSSLEKEAKTDSSIPVPPPPLQKTKKPPPPLLNLRQSSLSQLIPEHQRNLKAKWEFQSPVLAMTRESLIRNRTFEVLNDLAELELRVRHISPSDDEEDSEDESHHAHQPQPADEQSPQKPVEIALDVGKDKSRGEEEMKPPGKQLTLKYWKDWLRMVGVNAIIGFIVFLIILPGCLSYASILTSHEKLAPYFPLAIKMLIFTHALHQLVATLLSGVVTNVPGVMVANIMFLSIIAENIAENAKQESAIFPTFLLCICLSSLLMGVAYIVMGYTNAIVAVQITMMSDMPLTEPRDLLLLLQDRRALLSLIGVSLATALFVVERFKQHILLMPAFLFVPMILFWVIAVSTGTSGSQLQQMGFIIPSTETVPFYSIWTSLDLSAVEYGLIPRQLPNMMVMILLILLSTSINLNGLEITMNRTIETKRELYVSGSACILAAFTSCFGGTMTIGLTGVAFNQGCNRLLGFFVVTFYLVVFLVPFSLTDYLPKFFFGTVLFHSGLSLLWNWLITPFHTLTRFEYTLLVITAGCIMVLGNNTGLPISITVGAVFFAIQYARINSIRSAYTGDQVRSRIQRPYFQRKILQHYRGNLYVLQLQNYLFFGSAVSILSHIKKQLKEEKPITEKSALASLTRKISTLFHFNGQSYHALDGESEEMGTMQEDSPHFQSAHLSATRKKSRSRIQTILNDKMKTFLDGLEKRKRSKKIRYLVIDFTRVVGVDSSACSTFKKVVQLCVANSVMPIFTGMTPSLVRSFQRRGVYTEDGLPKTYDSLDLALEWVENVVIKKKVRHLGTQLTDEISKMPLEDYVPSFHVLLSNLVPQGGCTHQQASEVVNRYFIKRKLHLGETLLSPEIESKSLFYIKSGQMGYYMTDVHGQRMRLYKTVEGTWAGVNGMFLNSSIQLNLEAEGPVTVFELTKEELERMQTESPPIAIAVFTAALQSMAQTMNILLSEFRMK
ncbi:hypothetical protein PROFUN_07219 [Planoprotostelium fungivorum]|uniref:STAS domain-containing protein n=1 Tax=Planoprotostelium fungivorum TaxID=1890364 RepID=A0A2P6NML3_9EUKA|nr:hypothetical protein PROFUN_07219 [Planoprotostelium fungivorum]